MIVFAVVFFRVLETRRFFRLTNLERHENAGRKLNNKCAAKGRVKFFVIWRLTRPIVRKRPAPTNVAATRPFRLFVLFLYDTIREKYQKHARLTSEIVVGHVNEKVHSSQPKCRQKKKPKKNYNFCTLKM